MIDWVVLGSEVWAIAALSLRVSLTAVFFAAIIGVPLGAWVSLSRFKGRTLLLAILNTLMGLPPVVAGLLVMMLLWRGGPLASLKWLYTPNGMSVAQTIIALPIVAALSASAFLQIPMKVRRQVQALGATRLQTFRLLSNEAKLGLFAAVLAALGRVLSEVASVMMVGGDIRGETRVLTTAITFEARQGNFEKALFLSLALMLLTFIISGYLTWLQFRTKKL